MRIIRVSKRNSLLYVPMVIMAFMIVACGTSSTGAYSGSGSHGTQTTTSPTIVKGYGTTNGCPSDAVVTANQPPANVILKVANVNSMVMAHPGNIIEVQLPFGQKWTGPMASEGALQLQKPAGYALKTNSMCIWRFVAQGTGKTQISFYGQMLCKPDEMCAMYITNMPFTIDVK